MADGTENQGQQQGDAGASTDKAEQQKAAPKASSKTAKAVVLHSEFLDPETGTQGILGDEIEVSAETFKRYSEIPEPKRDRKTNEIRSGADPAVDVPALAKPGSDLAKRAVKAAVAGLASTPHPSFRDFE